MPAPAARPAILADVCEALIGAVYLDGGYKAAEELVERLWQARMRATGAAAARSQDHVAGMGAGARPADAGLSRGRALRSRPQSRIPRRRAASRTWRRPKAWAAPSAPPNRPPPPPCWRARASSRRGAMADGRRTGAPLRLRGADRRAECRQVDADQCAGRRQGLDRHAQGADHAHAHSRHRHRRRGAAHLRRHAGDFLAAAPARPRHGRHRLGQRAGCRPRRAPDRCAQRRSTTTTKRSCDALADVRPAKVLVLNKVDLVDKPALLDVDADAQRARRRSPRPS